jgi:hypothetical protein
MRLFRLFRCRRWFLPALMFMFLPITSLADVSISVTIAPPPLPVYQQPLCPEQGAMWVPGYWAWGEDGYYWVPGEWVIAPRVGALWTPPWWGWDHGHYRFHEGYWGDEVGYYGGIDYGYGYMGVGFVGGEWRDGAFAYNTAVMRVNTTVIHNTFVNENIVREDTIANSNRVDYNGGPGGIRHDPTTTERTAMAARHTGPTQVQMQQVQTARADRASYAKVNGGHPHTLAMARPAESAGGVRNETNRSEGAARTAPEPRSSSTVETPRATETHRTPHAESRTPVTRSESRPAPSRTEPERSTRPREARTTPSRPEPRTTERPHTESRSVTPPRAESRPVPETHSESRPAPRTETHEARPEARPAPKTQTAPQHESRPAPRTESRPVPETRAESHPAPPPHPQSHAAAHPAEHESRPAPASKQNKPKEEPHK